MGNSLVKSFATNNGKNLIFLCFYTISQRTCNVTIYSVFVSVRAVTGTCTSVERKKELENIGFEVHLFNANEPE